MSRFLRAWVYGLLSLFVAAPAFAQSQTLIDAAKKEGGKVVVYMVLLRTTRPMQLRMPSSEIPDWRWHIGALRRPKS